MPLQIVVLHSNRLSPVLRVFRSIALAFRLVPSTLAIREQADVQYLFSNGHGPMDGLGVSATARLDSWHPRSVSRVRGDVVGLRVPQ